MPANRELRGVELYVRDLGHAVEGTMAKRLLLKPGPSRMVDRPVTSPGGVKNRPRRVIHLTWEDK